MPLPAGLVGYQNDGTVGRDIMQATFLSSYGIVAVYTMRLLFVFTPP
jgi:hypothetical protein